MLVSVLITELLKCFWLNCSGYMFKEVLYLLVLILSEPVREKTNNLHRQKQRRRSAELCSNFVFATRIVLSLFFLKPEFQCSSLLLLLQADLCWTWSETQIVGFLMQRLKCKKVTFFSTT